MSRVAGRSGVHWDAKLQSENLFHVCLVHMSTCPEGLEGAGGILVKSVYAKKLRFWWCDVHYLQI